MENAPTPAVEASVLRGAMAPRLHRGSIVTDEITIPAVPAMLDEYMPMCATLFGAVSRPFTD